MVSRSGRYALASLLCAACAAGCTSRQGNVQRAGIEQVNTIAPGLIAAAPDTFDAELSPAATSEGIAWLATRNDSHVIPQDRIPEVSDPGSYWIQTRDYQRTINGRPWNYWTTRTWIQQRGSGR